MKSACRANRPGALSYVQCNHVAGARIGALTYNLAHSYAAAVVVLGAGLVADLTGAPRLALLGVSLIWCAHIGFDRALGYGLKSREGFRLTHLGKIGRDKPPQTPARL